MEDATPKKVNPHEILPGDFLHLEVPPNRMIEAGPHATRVYSVLPKSRRFEQAFILEILIAGESLDEESAIRVFIQFSTSKDLRLTGHGFLGMEQWPVKFTHEQNVARRLKLSIAALKKERKHGTD